MRLKNVYVICPCMFTLIFVGLSGCEKREPYVHPAIKKDQEERALFEKTHQVRPATDPSLCKDNPEGYLYFKVGEELFRVNKDSSIVINEILMNVDEQGNPIPEPTGIPKGCRDNPLHAGNSGDLFFKNNFKVGRDDVLIKAKLQDFRFGIDEVPLGDFDRLTSTLYSMKDFNWDNRDKIYRDQEYGENGDFICEDVAENLTHCRKKFLVDKGLKEKLGVYVGNPAIIKSAQNLPFVFQCDPAIPEVKCNAYYRLYPTVNLSYSIRYKNPEKFDPKTFLPLDQYIRQMYESMRVKK